MKTCSHGKTGVRRRTIRGGGVQYVHQCLLCGAAVSQAISRAAAVGQGDEPEEFCTSLQDAWGVQCKAEREESSAQFWADYSAYLKTAEWALRRFKVLDRANGLCEGCREKPATIVHHLSYDHVGNELLFELAAVCSACHDIAHEAKSRDSLRLIS